MGLLIFFVLLAVGVSFLCSLLEASLLSLPRSHVQALVDHGSAAGQVLQKMQENIDRPLTAILTLNTVANTAGAVGVGSQAAEVFGSGAVGVSSALLTITILVVSEVIPKTLGAVYARALAPVTARTIQVMMVLCFPLVAVLGFVQRLLSPAGRTPSVSRSEMLASMRLGQAAGVLDRREFRIIANLLALDGVRLARILTPRTVLFALPQDASVQAVLDEHQPLRFARMPVYGDSLDEITGYVTRFDIHRAVADGGADARLATLAKPVAFLPEVATVADALEVMLDKQQHIAVIVDEFGGTAGIATLEDVFEALLGSEIVDETDAVVDMQQLARERRGGE